MKRPTLAALACALAACSAAPQREVAARARATTSVEAPRFLLVSRGALVEDESPEGAPDVA
ncbi:MAG TPA: hypothetical protein VGM56_13270, partial [Byssovorax sp.]